MERRVAILSLQSHGDRSFLDDSPLALVSGDLQSDGVDCDLVVAVLEPNVAGVDPAEERLAQKLSEYSVVVYDRVWSRALIDRLRARLPGKIFVWARGEHMLENPPADYLCRGDMRSELPEMIARIFAGRGQDVSPALFPIGKGGSEQSERGIGRPFRPNVRPVIINPEALTGIRVFSIEGNIGCAYQADARANPIYAGVKMPDGMGRGCAFCTTGNKYEGKPNDVTAAFVLEQIRYLKTNAPDLEHIVLKDQNPFAYLTQVMDGCAAEKLSPLVLMLQTRADWFARNLGRFERALDVARTANIKLSPFLVGIENFSQAELDRFNKGMKAEENVTFLDALWRWKETHGDALDLTHAAFGFLLFSPWTTLADLRLNFEGIRRTKLDRLRGRLLTSRTRLYPDTALYYLAERDGLLADEFAGAHEDASSRFGYYPSRPWKFANPAVARFSEIAAQLDERANGRDELILFEVLLDAFDRTADFQSIDTESLWSEYRARSGADEQTHVLRRRFAKLVHPLPLDGEFASGWRFGPLQAEKGRVRVPLLHRAEPPVLVELALHSDAAPRARSRHYDLITLGGNLTPPQDQAVAAVCEAVVRND